MEDNTFEGICQDCKYAVNYSTAFNAKTNKTGVLKCHRFPPQYIEYNDIRFPVVNEDDFCGEFKKKKD